jgi:hypothetical protein
MLIIGLHGPMGAGKSTIADELRSRCDGKVMPFAGPLKSMARSLGWDGKKDAKGRKFLQTLGTEICRAYDNEYWIKKMESLIQMEFDNPTCKIIIIDDVRFRNEAALIHKMGGIVIKLTGRGKISKWKLWLQEHFGWLKTFVHASEIPLPDCYIDDTVENDSNWTPRQVVERILYLHGSKI